MYITTVIRKTLDYFSFTLILTLWFNLHNAFLLVLAIMGLVKLYVVETGIPFLHCFYSIVCLIFKIFLIAYLFIYLFLVFQDRVLL